MKIDDLQIDEVNQNTLITETINQHGLLFKRAVLRELTGLGIQIISDEYPVNYLTGTSIDIVGTLQFKRCEIIATFECKKVYIKSKSWVFFESEIKDRFLGHEFREKEMFRFRVPSQFEIVEVRDGIEIEKKGEKFSASADVLFQACSQAAKGATGWIIEELKQRQQKNNVPLIPLYHLAVLITNAPLFVIKSEDIGVDLMSGNSVDDLKLIPVEFVVYNFPFAVPSGAESFSGDGDNYASSCSRVVVRNLPILIINSTKIREIKHFIPAGF